jgi:hypothetical protein
LVLLYPTLFSTFLALLKFSVSFPTPLSASCCHLAILRISS